MKKRRSIRTIAMIMAAALTIVPLASCEKSGGNDTDTVPGTGTSPATGSGTDEVTGPGENKGDDDIKYIEKEAVEYTTDNLDEYSTPEWWRDAKFGIFIHYGAYSVPAFGDEWYGHWMYMPGTHSYGGSDIYTYHKNTYGGVENFGYKDFIPDFVDALKTAKENNAAEEWAQLFYDAGAKYVMPVGIHHDSIALYDSGVQTTYNTVNLAGIDYISDLQAAVKGKGLKFGISNHFAENDWFFDDASGVGTDMADKTYSELYGTSGKTEAHIRKWYSISMEIIEKYHPDIIYYDFDLGDAAFDRYDDANRYLMLANYYHLAQGWDGNEGVVCNYKYGAFTQSQAVLNSERSVLNEINPTPWQTDTSIGSKSWCYTTDEVYRGSSDFIGALVDIVSKNGNLLLNVGPKADGTIPAEAKNTLLEIGAWLGTYGDAIYETRPWLVYGEGPTQNSGDNYTYTARDIRFTRSKDMKKLYVSALAAPRKGTMSVTTLKKGEWNADSVDKICLIQGGDRIELDWTQTESALEISLPDSISISGAYSVEITFKNGGTIPALTMDAGNTVQAYNYEEAAGLGLSVATEDGTDTIVNLRDGAYAKYLLNFDEKYTSFIANVSGGSAGTVTVRRDSPDGDVLLTLDVEKDGGGYRYVTGLTESISGVHSIYVELQGAVELNWFKFASEKNINEVIEAEDFDAKYGDVKAEPCSDKGGGENLGYVQNDMGNYVMYARVNFGDGASKLYMRLAGDGQSCNVRIDSVDGEIIANTGAIRTGGWTSYITYEFDISGVTGVHDVYITYDTGRSDLNINWLAFSDGSFAPEGHEENTDSREKVCDVQFGAEFFDEKKGAVIAEPCSDTGSGQNLGYVGAGDWVKYSGFDFGDGASHLTMRLAGYGSTIEIRLDGTDGELIATFAPSTGGWGNYSTFDADLPSAVAGKHDVYIVFRDSVNVNWFMFSNNA